MFKSWLAGGHLSKLILSFLLLLIASVTATAETCGSEPAKDEFCGKAPPAQMLQITGHQCCSETLCRCNSRICGGPNTRLTKQDFVVPPSPERLPGKSSDTTFSRSHSKLPQPTTLPTMSKSPDPPTPPPPEHRKSHRTI